MFQDKVKKHHEISNALRLLKNSDLINSFLDLENKELSKKLYIDALFIREQEKKYHTDLTIINTMLKPIVSQLKQNEWELYDITVLISDLFIHFKFKKTHNQDYESVRKRIDTMLRRL